MDDEKERAKRYKLIEELVRNPDVKLNTLRDGLDSTMNKAVFDEYGGGTGCWGRTRLRLARRLLAERDHGPLDIINAEISIRLGDAPSEISDHHYRWRRDRASSVVLSWPEGALRLFIPADFDDEIKVDLLIGYCVRRRIRCEAEHLSHRE